MAVALAESAIDGNLGVALDWVGDVSQAAALFAESQSRAVVSVTPNSLEAVEALLKNHNLSYTVLGKTVNDTFCLCYNGSLLIKCRLDELSHLWNGAIGEIMKEEISK